MRASYNQYTLCHLRKSKNINQNHHICLKYVIFISFLRLDVSLLHRSILIVPTVVAVAIYGFLSTTRSKMGARWLRFVIFLKKMSYFIQILGFLDLHRDLAIPRAPSESYIPSRTQNNNITRDDNNFGHIKMSYFIQI